MSKQRRTKTTSGGMQFQPIEQPWHVEKTCREALEQISAEGCAFQFLPTIACTKLEICMFPTHILNLLIRWVEEFGRADAIARREPVGSIMPFLLYCAAVSMAHLTVCGQTLRQAAG